MTNLNQYNDTILRLATYVQSNNLDISSPEKLQEAFRLFLHSSLELDNNIKELPLSFWKGFLKLD